MENDLKGNENCFELATGQKVVEERGAGSSVLWALGKELVIIQFSATHGGGSSCFITGIGTHFIGEGSCNFQPSFTGGSLSFVPNGRGWSCVF